MYIYVERERGREMNTQTLRELAKVVAGFYFNVGIEKHSDAAIFECFLSTPDPSEIWL